MPPKNITKSPRRRIESSFGDDFPTFGFATQKINQKISICTPLVRFYPERARQDWSVFILRSHCSGLRNGGRKLWLGLLLCKTMYALHHLLAVARCLHGLSWRGVEGHLGQIGWQQRPQQVGDILV
ncbi:hypothetical protein [Herbaspirillum sp. B65]|uniref:hypothetical protein n=1 Tax=Herbaspirillum sp. B65 TaxID=137708 RepID=UPI0011D2303C|nr:hypothetical protein [Herbaspirillum sp. B65]